jgi:hypothetical protein
MKRENGVWKVKIAGDWIVAGDLEEAFAIRRAFK